MHGLRRACTSFNRPALLSLFTSCDRMLTTRHVKLNVHPSHLQYDVYDPIAVSSTRSATPSYTVNKRTHITYIQITIDWPHFKTLSYKRESIQSRAPHMLQVYVYIGWLRYANNNARLNKKHQCCKRGPGTPDKLLLFTSKKDGTAAYYYYILFCWFSVGKKI